MSAWLETFLERQRRRDRSVPRFVERELRGFLECGILAHGFLRVHCHTCGRDRLVAYSCKGRGFCSSCGGRRMAETAAHLVDRVFPEVPVRQWVLSLPFALRYRMAYDPSLVRDVLRVFLRTVFSSLRRAARNRHGSGRRDRGRFRCGAVTFIQRFGGALNLNVHFHSLVIDGVYDRARHRAAFFPLPPPDDAEVAWVAAAVRRKLARLLERRGLSDADPEHADPLSRDQPLLAALYSASVRGRIATGPQIGRRVARLGDRVEAEDIGNVSGPRCVAAAGVSVHASISVPARDRSRLERLCRYVARPALASEGLSLLPDGRVAYALRHPYRDGTTHVAFEPVDFVGKLAALVPPPRFNMVRYHGVLAAAASLRSAIVPEGPGPGTPDVRPAGCTGASDAACSPSSEAPPDEPPPNEPSGVSVPRRSPRPRNYSWAELMHRVWAIDVLECPACQGRMSIIAALRSTEAIRAILECLGLPSRAPPIAAAVAEPDEDAVDRALEFDPTDASL